MAYASISKPSLHFNTKLYTGTGSENAITGVGFQPDLTWIKNRDTTDWHRLQDAVRGATKEIYSNAGSAEYTQAQSLKSFNTDGFTLGTLDGVNTSSEDYTSWNWKAGNSAGSSNSDGSITSTVSANTASGFSIVKYTGTASNATVGHGLGVAPKVVLIKDLGGTENWAMYHSSVGATKVMRLNSDIAAFTASNRWNSTAPTSSVFNIGTAAENNTSGENYIAYCFAEKKGFSKFGKYVGNGNADGTFIYCGFKPAYVFTKSMDTSSHWNCFDNKRSPINVVNDYQKLNEATAEDTNVSDIQFDFLSNGLKLRGNNDEYNGSSENYIYMCFAAEPLVANVGQSIPATAE